jgi:hypothetical protein
LFDVIGEDILDRSATLVGAETLSLTAARAEFHHPFGAAHAMLELLWALCRRW